jgi:hypothetical protein
VIVPVVVAPAGTTTTKALIAKIAAPSTTPKIRLIPFLPLKSANTPGVVGP